MVWLLDNGYAMRRFQQSLGWRRVVLSQHVWRQFVAIPHGIRGQSEDLRIWDLLIFLRVGISDLANPDRVVNRVGFLASVVNDNRDSRDDMDDADYLPTDFQLVASAGVDEAGFPCLVVMLPHEECLM
jgi:hypothetical protein